MAKNTATGSGTGHQVIGKVFIIYGTVKAVAPDGTVRILAPNSPVFADEKIITDSDGSVSIMLDGPPPTQLDLGRMTEIVLNEDVYAVAAPEAATEATTEAQKIQETLLQGEQPIELEATAAGGAAGAGGGHPIVMFDLTGNEVTPGSGAETSGITTTGSDTTGGAFNNAPTIDATHSSGFTEALDASAQALSDGGTVFFGDVNANDLVSITYESNDDIAWSKGEIDSSLAAKLIAGFSTGEHTSELQSQYS